MVTCAAVNVTSSSNPPFPPLHAPSAKTHPEHRQPAAGRATAPGRGGCVAFRGARRDGARPRPAGPERGGEEGAMKILHLEDNSTDAELVRLLITDEWPDCQITCVSTRFDYVGELGR